MGPVPSDDEGSREDSFVYSLMQQRVIERPIYSVFVSRFDDISSSVMFGDFNETYIDGGE
jgi:hypothetical protein